MRYRLDESGVLISNKPDITYIEKIQFVQDHVKASGEVYKYYSLSQEELSRGPSDPAVADKTYIARQLRHGASMAMFALALINTKNVEIVDSHEMKVKKRRRRKKKRTGTRHYTLRIRPGGRKSASDSQATGDKNSFHLARGHFKTYTEDNPLFGRHTGTYWWEAQVRGSKTKGTITKDYEVHPPIENKETTK